ncbi:MAG: 30S ribosomal protein S20 [Candidatus Tumulicola sp.]
MPNIKAAEKWSRQSAKRTTRNKDAATRLKTLFRKAATSGDAAAAAPVDSAYDKAASKGIIHPNKAARKKSRLAKAILNASAAPAKSTRSKAAKSTKSGAAKKAAKK